MAQGKARRAAYVALRLLGSLLGFALLAWLAHKQGWDSPAGRAAFLGGISSLPPASLVLALSLVAVSRMCVAGRWHLLLLAAGARVSPAESFSLTFAGLFAGNVLPTTIGGDAVRMLGAVRRGYDSARVAASLVADRMTGALGMVFALPFALPLLAPHINEWIMSGMIPLLFCGIIAAGSLRKRFSGWVGVAARAFALCLHRPAFLMGAIGLTGVHLLCYAGAVRILLAGLGEPVAITTAIGLWTLVYFITLPPVSINGLGVQEAAVAFCFTNFDRHGMPAALAVAMFMRVMPLIASMPGAFCLSTVTASPVARAHDDGVAAAP